MSAPAVPEVEPTRGPPARGEPASAGLRWVLVLVVFLAAAAPFLPALGQGFVELDDDRNFLMNEAYRGLGAENLRWMFTQSHMGHYHPLTWLTLAFDYQLYGLDGAGYHATNLLFHALGAVALYFLALALFRLGFGGLSDARLRLAAAVGALAHAMHPLRVESVAWATERRDVQSGLLLVLTALLYLRWVRTRSAATFALALCVFAASLLSKAWGITLPAVLLVLDLWPLGRRRAGEPWKRLLLEKVAFAVPALIVAWLAARAQGAAFARESLADHTLPERCVQACYGLAFYLRKTLWPTDLSALYWLEMDVDPLRPAHVVAYGIVAAVTTCVLLARRRFPALLVGWVVFAIVVSPVLGFLQSGFQKVADRYSYVACIPFGLLLGAGLAALARARAAAFGAGLAASGAVLFALGVLGWRQTLLWRDSEALYERVVAVEPDNYFGWHNLAVQYQKQGRIDEAIEAERRSIEAHPGRGNAPARVNLAHLLARTGHPDESRQAMRGALAADPSNLDALRAVIAEHLARGDRGAALAAAEDAAARAGELRPPARDLVGVFAELARLQLQAGEIQRSMATWHRAAEAVPESARARHGVGAALLALDRDEDAHLWLDQAFRMDNNDVELAVDYARVLARGGQATQASDLLRQVLARQPGHPRAAAALRAIEAGGRP